MSDDAAGEELRDPDEIAARFLALNLLFTWVVAGEDEVPAEEITTMLEEHGLNDFLTDDERASFDQSRDEAHDDGRETIGWKLENMWPLAWALGFEREPSTDGEMIDEATTQAMLFEFAARLLAEAPRPRSAEEVARLADAFQEAPPNDVIAERLHALVWCLSPETDWDEL